MSSFSSVDSAPEPERLACYLDETARSGASMKHYTMAAHARHRPSGLILDVGCGAGHYQALLASAGLRAVGVDPSVVLLEIAARRLAATSAELVRATGEALPFRDGSFAGARIERVLQHVVDPSAVLAEVVRCLRGGALLTAYEPYWSGFRVRSDDGDEPAGWISGARNPDVGGALWRLVEATGCVVLDRVEELSVWRSLEVLDRVVLLAQSVARAVRAGRIGERDADRWLAHQRARQAEGRFHATMPKVLIVATKL